MMLVSPSARGMGRGKAMMKTAAMSLNAIGVKGDGGIVDALIAAGFEVDAELVSMTYEVHELPGERGLYLGLMHPTLG